LALHDPPLNSAFIDDRTSLVSQPWVEWLIITKRDKIDAVDDAVDGNIPTFDEDGHLEDSNSSVSSVISDIVALKAADVLIQADIDALEAADVLIQADVVALEAADVLLQAEDLAIEARSYFYALNI
jgi:hypothetical protein